MGRPDWSLTCPVRMPPLVCARRAAERRDDASITPSARPMVLNKFVIPQILQVRNWKLEIGNLKLVTEKLKLKSNEAGHLIEFCEFRFSISAMASASNFQFLV